MIPTFCLKCRKRVWRGLDAGHAAYYEEANAVRLLMQDGGTPRAIRIAGVYVRHGSRCDGAEFSNVLPLAKLGKPRRRTGSDRDRIPASVVRARRRVVS